MLKSVIKLIIVVGLVVASYTLLDSRVFWGVFLFVMAGNVSSISNKVK